MYSVVTHSEFMERSSAILAECSATCLYLQDVLSPVLARETHLGSAAMMQMQTLDRLSQQLDDLSNLFRACATDLDDRPAAFPVMIATATKLAEIRDKIMGHTPPTAIAADLDLF